MLHKIKYLIIIFVLILIPYIISAQQNNEQEKFVYDEANILYDKSKLNDLINQVYNYKNSVVKIVIITSDDENRIKSIITNGAGFSEFGLDNTNNKISNLNILIVYKPGWSRPALIYSKNCGLDVNRINEIINLESYLDGEEERELKLTEYFFVYENYNAGFEELLTFLVDEIKQKIDEEELCLLSKFSTRINPELFPDIESIPIKQVDINRVNTYQSYFDEAHRLYPAIPINLGKAVVKQESNGVRTSVSSVGALGLTQIMPCTAKELKLVQTVKCLQCRDGSTKCNPCTSSRSQEGRCLKSAPGNGYNYAFDARKNIISGFAYLNKKLDECAGLPEDYERLELRIIKKIKGFITNSDIEKIDRITSKFKDNNGQYVDEEVIKCGLAAYNAGYGNIQIATVKADSLSFNDYQLKFKTRTKLETPDYIVKVLGYYKWLG